jgi:hypothetical protein
MPTISEHDALPAGTRLGEFEIQRVLGIGGFGVVYLAFDHALERQVAIKEYMPAALASRGVGADIVVRSAAHAETFNLGLRSFINEARLLARFDHPSLVKVYRFWEAHGTAYMVMPYYRGLTLQQVRRDMSAPPDEAWLRRLLNPLLGALDCLHRENVFHRDVAPDNILLLDDETGPGQGPPVLLDLGAARHVIGDRTQTLTAIVKPSFAPIEQYAETVQLRQGPWTDLYALAAVVHFCITGRPPMPATVRTVHDELPSLNEMTAGLASGFDRQYSESFVHAIDHALAVRPQDRPDSVAAWREELSGIVSDGGLQVGAAVERDPAWFAQTVLVRNEAQEAPPGHQVMQAQSFMTTIPAAGKLNAPPAWPGERHGAEPDQGTGRDAATLAKPVIGPVTQAPRPYDDFAPTMNVPPKVQAGVGVAVASAAAARQPDPQPDVVAPIPATVQLGPHRGSAEGNGPHASNTDTGTGSWLRWVFGAMLLITVGAVWWSSHQAARVKPAEPGVLAAAQQSVPKGEATATSAKARHAASPASAASPAASRAAARARKDADAAAQQAEETREVAQANEPLSPRKACAGRSFIMLAICMKRHCVRPDYTRHPECERMRQQEAAQRSNYP